MSVVAAMLILPTAGLLLAAGLLTAAIAVPWLSAADKMKIFEGNARKVYSRLNKQVPLTT